MSESTRRLTPEQEAAAGRAALLRLLRVLLVAVIVPVVVFAVVDIGEQPGGLRGIELQLVQGWPWVVLFGFALAFGVIAIDALTPEKKISTLSGVFLGLAAGVLAAIAMGYLLDLVARAYDIDPRGQVGGVQILSTIKVLFGIALTYLAVSIVLQTQDQFRLLIPYVEFSKQIRGARPLLLDSSAIIDGRIVALGETGVIQEPVLIPRFVLGELQTLSDSADRMKRARGRRGLETVTALQRAPHLDVSIDETPQVAATVDLSLVDLARGIPATIVTNDAGLARLAAVHSVGVLNMNDVANAMKPNVTPGEPLTLRIIKPGEQAGQGVGYLDDGTMVVVEDGAEHIGDEVTIGVTSSLQTSAGRLIFGRLDAGPGERRRSRGDADAGDAQDSAPAARPAGASESDAPEGVAPGGDLPSDRARARAARPRNPRRKR